MSRIKLEGHENGTGTVTITAPNTNTDRAITIPDEGGAILTNGGALGVSDSAPNDSLNIDSSGKVALCTTSVTSDSQVAIGGGNLELTTAGARYWVPRASDGAGTGSLYSEVDNDVTLSGEGSGSGYIRFKPSSGSGEAMRIDSNGKVGIGTDSPSTALHVVDGGATVTTLGDGDTAGGYSAINMVGASNRTSWQVGQNSQATHALTFTPSTAYGGSTFTTPTMALLGGNVGIGSNSPSAGRLTIYNSNSVTGLYAENTVSGEILNVWRMPGTGTQTCAQLQNNGGSTVCGSIQVSGSSAYYNTSSDYRLKENVVDMDGAIDRVKALSPKRFNWIVDEDDTTVDGFLAHEVSDVVPEAISGEKDATDDEGNAIYQGIDQSKLVPLLTAAIKEQQTIIDDLKTRIETLENA